MSFSLSKSKRKRSGFALGAASLQDP